MYDQIIKLTSNSRDDISNFLKDIYSLHSNLISFSKFFGLYPKIENKDILASMYDDINSNIQYTDCLEEQNPQLIIQSETPIDTFLVEASKIYNNIIFEFSYYEKDKEISKGFIKNGEIYENYYNIEIESSDEEIIGLYELGINEGYTPIDYVVNYAPIKNHIKEFFSVKYNILISDREEKKDENIISIDNI